MTINKLAVLFGDKYPIYAVEKKFIQNRLSEKKINKYNLLLNAVIEALNLIAIWYLTINSNFSGRPKRSDTSTKNYIFTIMQQLNGHVF